MRIKWILAGSIAIGTLLCVHQMVFFSSEEEDLSREQKNKRRNNRLEVSKKVVPRGVAQHRFHEQYKQGIEKMLERHFLEVEEKFLEAEGEKNEEESKEEQEFSSNGGGGDNDGDDDDTHDGREEEEEEEAGGNEKAADHREDGKYHYIGEGDSKDRMIDVHSKYKIPRYRTLFGPEHETITGDVNFLLDFAVLGFGKCGTTTLMRWLENHEQVRMFDKESYLLENGRDLKLVKKLYGMKIQSLEAFRKQENKKIDEINNGTTSTHRRRAVVRYDDRYYYYNNYTTTFQGFKSPSSLRTMRTVRGLDKYYPQTKIIVSVRHPVLWFKSLYNFFANMANHPRRARQRYEKNLLDLLGEGDRCVICIGKGTFHAFLAKLGKTPLVDKDELDLFLGYVPNEKDRRQMINRKIKTKNKVFFLETSQLGDPNTTRAGLLRKDLGDFMGFDEDKPLTAPPHISPGKKKKEETTTPAKTTALMQTLVSLEKEEEKGRTTPAQRRHLSSRTILYNDSSSSSSATKSIVSLVVSNNNNNTMVAARKNNNNKIITQRRKLQQEKINTVNVDLCHSNYTHVRTALMELSRNASIWFRDYFLKSDDVVVSSREYLNEIFMTWMDDPCDEDNDLTF